MSRYRATLGLVTWLALAVLLSGTGCSRPAELNDAEGSAVADPHPVPFRAADGTGSGDSNTTAVSQVSDKSAKTEASPPFRDTDNLPAGTLLTVRLKNAVSTDNPETRGRFEGVIDEPVAVNGTILVPSGTNVSGRMESALQAKAKRSGFVRVTLDTIDIAGKDLHLQTSSLFARATDASHGSSAETVSKLEKGRRLTFRLTEPASVVQPASSSR